MSRRKILLIALLCMLMPVSALSLHAQTGPDNELLRAIAQYLRRQLNRPIAQIDSYTYEVASFADSSFGCPEAGKTYDPGPFNGYKFLITYQGIAYDVRTSTDGTRMVLCSNTEIKQTTALAVYRGAQFSLPYPSGWTVTERVNELYFGLDLRPICSQPGMSITMLGDPKDQAPDALIDNYLKTTTSAQVEQTRADIGKIGRSVLYIAPCADGSARQHRLTVFVAYGQAYRVPQFAPETAYAQWADTYLQILKNFAPSGGSVTSGSQDPIKAPAFSPRSALIHIFNGNVYSGLLVDLPGIPLSSGAVESRSFRYAVPSPRGDLVAFVDPFQKALYVAPIRGGSPARKLAEQLRTEYPITWNPKGTEIAVVGNDGSLVAITVDAVGGRRLGDPPATAENCPPSQTTDPALSLYAGEMGVPGNYARSMVWLKRGPLLISGPCGVGLDVIDTVTGKRKTLITDALYRWAISPDESTLIGVAKVKGASGDVPALVYGKLESLDSLTIAPIKSAAGPDQDAPDQVAWGSDSKTVYYATLTLKDTIRLDDPADQERGQRVFGAWPLSAQIYTVSLRRIDLTTGVDEELFKGDGRGISRIAPSPDGAGTLFTVVESSARLIEGFKNNVSQGEMMTLAPNMRLYWLPITQGSTAQLVVMSHSPAWGPTGSGPAPTPTGGPGMEPPTPTRKPANIVLTATPTPQP